jgi:dipeptidyl aminopeptidase/acylaminoacyl peptidase
MVDESGLNTPPQVVAIDTGSGQRRLVWDPSPRFEERRFGRVEDVKGIGAGGHEVRRGLYLPPGYSPGQKYIRPVILTLVASV